MQVNSIIAIALSCAIAHAQDDLVSVLQDEDDLSTITSVVPQLPDIQQFLSTASNLTMLLPTDDAIAALPADSWEGQIFASQDIDGIAAILSLHVLNGVYRSTDFSETPTFVSSVLTDIEPINGRAVANVTGGQNVGLVLNGSDATILSGYLSTATVTEADIEAANNLIIHKIDSVLRLPLNVSATAELLNLTAAAAALNSTGLTETADTIADLTIFVPNDEAFQAIESTLASASVEQITGILSYHAIAGNVLFSSELSNTSVASLLPGSNLTVTVSDNGDVFVNDAQVVVPNVILSNGVAHVIDSVLNPEGATGGAAGGASGGAGPSGGSNATNTTTTPTPYTGAASGHMADMVVAASAVLMVVMLAL